MKNNICLKKVVALFASSCIFCFSGCFSECEQNTVSSETSQKPVLRKIAFNEYAYIYDVKIDGAEYIVVLGAGKAAITPKVSPQVSTSNPTNYETEDKN